MAFPSINEFKERMKDGGARPSLFRMQITWPAALQNAAAQALLPFHCRISEIPGTQVNPIVTKYAGREIKFAGQRIYQNLRVTVINDTQFTVRKALEQWHEAINSRQTNVAVLTSPTPDGYAGQAQVTQFDLTGASVRTYTFVDLFPLTVEPIALSWDNDAEIETYGIEFAYQYWTDTPSLDGVTGAGI